jgi:glutamine amidotransferase
MKIAIVDYSVGNVQSIINCLTSLGITAYLSNNEREIGFADALILPGVGNFEAGISNLKKSGLDKSLQRLVIEEGVPVLGICLGMQVMTLSSDESNIPGLGWLPYKTEKMSVSSGRKLPNIGWNSVEIVGNHSISSGLRDDARFYFSHSYAILSAPSEFTLFKATYESEFVAGVCFANIFGVQFHPEKSHKDGEIFLRNFVDFVCAKD